MGIPDNIQAVFFDCYNTLIEIGTDEDDPLTWQMLSSWLSYQGVAIGARDLMHEYRRTCREQAVRQGESYPEIDVEAIFVQICRDHRLWDLDARRVGRRAARTFRAASVRKKKVFPESLRLLEHLRGLPMGIVSNGQRVFSEHELRHLGLRGISTCSSSPQTSGSRSPTPGFLCMPWRNSGSIRKTPCSSGTRTETTSWPRGQSGCTRCLSGMPGACLIVREPASYLPAFF